VDVAEARDSDDDEQNSEPDHKAFSGRDGSVQLGGSLGLTVDGRVGIEILGVGDAVGG